MSAGRVVTRFDEHGARGRVARLTIAREAKLNALDPETIAALAAAARALHDDETLRAVVVTGAGERAFIGGADIATMAKLDADGGQAFITALHAAIAAVRAIPVPVIARVNGYCLGAGLEVAAGCDLRVASTRAMFGMPEVRVGMPSVIEAALLPRLIGMGRTAELVLLGENVDAEKALAIGLVEKVVPPERLDATVDAWIEAILAAGPQAVRLQKALMRDWERLPLDEAIKAGIVSFRTSVAGGEPRRMLAEFTARRRRAD
ncbi:MAG TPA: enoyl-CoA hydratase [Xanthobacteraceae bacterium]|jgi:enoyl-CoA hydratase/carnithine racemase|nr:enoyl-CoA hydratase [Xanthobacteraceae bacterium]